MEKKPTSPLETRPQRLRRRLRRRRLRRETRGSSNSNKQIACQLCIDETTAKTHLHRIFEKLDVRDRTQAAIFALQQGWFAPQ